MVFLASSEARNLRADPPAAKFEAAANNAEERVFNIRRNPNGPALVSFKPSKWDKFRGVLAKILLPKARDGTWIYKGNKKWKFEPLQ